MFKSARIHLTLWYLLILMIVSIAFSLVIYRLLTIEVDRLAVMHRLKIERLAPRPKLSIRMIDPDIIRETKRRIITILAITNGVVLLLSGGLSYLLAGRTLKPIKDMVDEQNRFISDASHEFRTPLTSLKSAFEVFLRSKNPTLSEAKNLATESIEEVNKLESLSNSLLDLAQYQTINGNMQLEKISLKTVISEAVKKISPIAKKKNIKIISEVRDFNIHGQYYGLVDLFIILLDNAIKYSPSKSKVSITSTKTDGSISVSVKDEGEGIDKADLPHIFGRFYRANKARTKKETGGYGLGLSIAKKIVDLHHGKITVESNKGKGSTFIIKLRNLHLNRS